MKGAIKKIIGALLLKLGACAACVAAAVAPGIGHGQAPTLESQVKATYLYNFIQFVEWPQDVWSKNDDFQLCVLGPDRLGAALDAFDGERIDSRSIRIRRLSNPDDVAAAKCHLVFLPRTGDSGQALARVPKHGVLTVGEAPNFAAAGGMINLYEVRGRVHFSINDRAVRRAGLIMSSRLLQLARERS